MLIFKGKVKQMQKKWKKPELIIMQKAQPQEAILTHCKTVVLNGNPETGTVGQTCGNPKANSCQACKARNNPS